MTSEPKLAGRYLLGRRLGAGGMGEVYAARDGILDREVAVKTLHVSDASPAALERFRREAQILARLTDPNIVTIFDFGIDQTHAWIVMELLAGPSLADRLGNGGPLPMSDVLAYGAQAATALCTAHRAGVIHRDVKPANLVLDAHGSVKLVDLGIARLAGAAGHTATLTETGSVLGSLPYVAPELMEGSSATPAVDIYALGASLFAISTGRPPFQGETPAATLAQHLNSPVPGLQTLRPDVPDDFDSLVTAMLAKDPSDRPSAEEVSDRLASAAELAAASADHDTVLLGPGGLVVPPVVGEPAATKVLDVDDTVPMATTKPTRMRRGRTRLVVAAIAFLLLLAAGALARNAFHQGAAAAPDPTSSPSVTSAPSQTPDPTPSPVATQGDGLDGVRTAISSVLAAGGIDPKDAEDLQHRVDDLAPHLNGNGKQEDLAHKVDDLLHHLGDLADSGHLSQDGYRTIESAIQQMLNAQGLSGGD